MAHTHAIRDYTMAHTHAIKDFTTAHTHAIRLNSLNSINMTQKKSEILLAAVIIARSTSLVFSKIALGAFGTFNLLALRFIAAFVLLGAIFFKKLVRMSPKDLLRGVILGILFTGVMTMELFGLRLSDSGTTSFIENSAMIFVPLLQLALFRKRPAGRECIRMAIAVTGIAVLTLGGSAGSILHTAGAAGMFSSIFGSGIPFLIGAAIFYAGAILATSHFSRESDPLDLGIVQVGTVGVLSLILSFIFESPRLPQSGAEWGMILALAIICSGFGFTLQPLAQRGTSAERAGMMCAISPLSAATLGIIFLGEQITIFKAIGCLLILASIFSEPLISRLRCRII